MTNGIYRSLFNIYSNCIVKCGKQNLNYLIRKYGTDLNEITTNIWPPYNSVMEQEYDFSMLFNCSCWETCDYNIITKRAIEVLSRAVYNKLTKHTKNLKERVSLYSAKGKHLSMYHIIRYQNNEPYELIYWFIIDEEIQSLTAHMHRILEKKQGMCSLCRISCGYISSDHIYDRVLCVYGGSNFNVHHLDEKKLKYIEDFDFSCFYWKRHSTRDILNCIFGGGGQFFYNAHLMIDMFIK